MKKNTRKARTEIAKVTGDVRANSLEEIRDEARRLCAGLMEESVAKDKAKSWATVRMAEARQMQATVELAEFVMKYKAGGTVDLVSLGLLVK